MADAETERIATPEGEARAHVVMPSDRPRGGLVLGHGAGGGVNAPDLLAAADAAAELGWAVALVEQPYRVAGRRSPAPAPRLDTAFTAAVSGLAGERFAGLAIVCGGRSAGARVACRTAVATGCGGVLCLAFPLQPPPRRGSTEPAPSRLGELDAVAVPVLVVQGDRDRFGMPPAAPGREVVSVAGDHALKRDRTAVRDAVAEWLAARG